jgi:hypothetical protein
MKVYQLVEGCIKFIPLPNPKKHPMFKLDDFKVGGRLDEKVS